jgi:rod shape determining protein RodA
MIALFGVQVAVVTPDRLGRLLCVGVVAMMFCHVWINIAMTVGLVPITGLPLPLLSYGGSFLVTTLAALGLIQSVYIRSPRRLFAWRV